MHVTLYTALHCPACKMTRNHLECRGITFTEIAIDSDPNILDAARELGLRQAPIVCVSTEQGEQTWDGYRPDRIDALGSTSR